MIPLYIADAIVVSRSREELSRLKAWLDFSPARHFLRVESGDWIMVL